MGKRAVTITLATLFLFAVAIFFVRGSWAVFVYRVEFSEFKFNSLVFRDRSVYWRWDRNGESVVFRDVWTKLNDRWHSSKMINEMNPLILPGQPVPEDPNFGYSNSPPNWVLNDNLFGPM